MTKTTRKSLRERMEEAEGHAVVLPGTERTFLAIDNELFFIKNGHFFCRVFYSDEGVEFRPYRDFVDQQKPNWKNYAAYNEYYSGCWNRRTASCGEVRE